VADQFTDGRRQSVGRPRDRSSWLCGATIFFIASVLLGCHHGLPPVLTVQMCLSNQQDVSRFLAVMQSISQTEGMRFVDGSADTEKLLQGSGNPDKERGTGSPAINVGILGEDGTGAIAGNLGLPPFQVAIGFPAGTNPTKARAFAELTVKRLQQQWRVVPIAAGSGAMPLADCDGN
jgi:hypothetical protein